MRQFFSIDYDHTYTSYPEQFNKFIELLLSMDVTVLFCTARQNNDWDNNTDIQQASKRLGIEIIYAGSESKWNALKAKGYSPEKAIWIDDTPRSIEGLSWE